MKTANWKATLARVFTVGVIAAAAAVAAPSRAEAQVSFGVRIGVPVYVAPPYRRPVYVSPAPVYVGPGYGYGYGYYGREYHPYAWGRHGGWYR